MHLNATYICIFDHFDQFKTVTTSHFVLRAVSNPCRSSAAVQVQAENYGREGRWLASSARGWHGPRRGSRGGQAPLPHHRVSVRPQFPQPRRERAPSGDGENAGPALDPACAGGGGPATWCRARCRRKEAASTPRRPPTSKRQSARPRCFGEVEHNPINPKL